MSAWSSRLKYNPAYVSSGVFPFLEPKKCAPPNSGPRWFHDCSTCDLKMPSLFGWTLVPTSQLNTLTSQISTLIAKVTAMSVELDNLSANVDKLIAAAEAETTLLISVKAALDAAIAAGNDGAQLQALSDKLAAEVAKVNAAIAANSPPVA